MNSNRDLDERAFPFAAEYGHPAGCGGMTLMDYFAGKAMTQLMGVDYSEHGCPGSPETTAESAYVIARAMMVERAKHGITSAP